MKTTAVTAAELARSAIAVPPLAPSAEFSPTKPASRALPQHIERGYIRGPMYGGHANLSHPPIADYADTGDFLADAPGLTQVEHQAVAPVAQALLALDPPVADEPGQIGPRLAPSSPRWRSP